MFINCPARILESKDRNRADNPTLADAKRKSGKLQVTEKFTQTDHSFSDLHIVLRLGVLA
jgi:hypothetical protein